jgi:hypothetical protein
VAAFRPGLTIALLSMAVIGSLLALHRIKINHHEGAFPSYPSPSLSSLLSLEEGILRAITTAPVLTSILGDTIQDFYPKMNGPAHLAEAQELSLVGGIDFLEKVQSHTSQPSEVSPQVRNSPPSGQPTKASRRARNHPQQWDSLKGAIRQIYLDQDNTLGMTMQIIEAKHGFTARQVLICCGQCFVMLTSL